MNTAKLVFLFLLESAIVTEGIILCRHHIQYKRAEACVDERIKFCSMLEDPSWCNVEAIINQCAEEATK